MIYSDQTAPIYKDNGLDLDWGFSDPGSSLFCWDWLKKSTDHAVFANGVARMQKKLRTSEGDYWIKQWFFSIVSLFKMGTSLKGKNLLPEGANSFL